MLIQALDHMKARPATSKVLIVDDEPTNLILLQRILKTAGYTRIRSTTDPRNVIPLVTDLEPDIVLLDLQMPRLDEFAVLEQLKEKVPATAFLPILVLTADVLPKTKLRALSSGAHDFLTKPFDQAEVVQRMANLLRTRELQIQVQAQNQNLEHLVAERTRELEEALRKVRETQQRAIQQERLHALGTMASGVAHDFNNALTVILGFGEVALLECEGELRREELEAHLHTIIAAGLDAASMVKRLRDFYRPPGENELRNDVRLDEIIKQAVATTRPRWHADSSGSEVTIRVETNLRETSPISADARELREAFINLIFNAVDAMPDGGTIRFSTTQFQECRKKFSNAVSSHFSPPRETRVQVLGWRWFTESSSATEARSTFRARRVLAQRLSYRCRRLLLQRTSSAWKRPGQFHSSNGVTRAWK